MIRRITGANYANFAKTGSVIQGAPVACQPWREFVNEFDADLEAAASSESEEAVVDLWLEDPRSFMEGEINPSHIHTGSMVRRMQTGGNGLRRADSPMAKQASAPSWDQEFAEATSHVRSVLSNLGNGTDRNYQHRPAPPGKEGQ